MSERIRRRFRAHGVVQGVGYRYFTVTMAERLGISGWVANACDGSVFVEAEGTPTAVSAFQTALKTGPSRARVLKLDSDELAPLGSTSFIVRHGDAL